MNDVDFDPDNDDTKLAEHLRLNYGVMDGYLFNQATHSQSYSYRPRIWILVSTDGYTG